MCDYEQVNVKTSSIEEQISLLKERIVELEKHNNINRIPRRAEQEDFSLDDADFGKPYAYILQFSCSIFRGQRKTQ